MKKKRYHYHVAYQLEDRVGSIALHMSTPMNNTEAIKVAQDLIRETNRLEKGAPVVILNFIELKGEEEGADVVKTCDTCLYEDEPLDMPPCNLCTRAHDTPPTQWDPKEEDA